VTDKSFFIPTEFFVIYIMFRVFRKPLFRLSVGLISIGLSPLARAEGFSLKHIEIEGQWVTTIGNQLQRPNNSLGDRIDVKALTDGKKAAARISATVELPIDGKDHQLRVSYIPYRAEGSSVSGTDFRYEGVAFSKGSVTQTNYKFDNYRFTYSVPLWSGQGWATRIGATLAVRDASTSFSQPGASVSYSNKGLVPLLYLAGQYDLSPSLRLKADFDGASFPGAGNLADATAKLEYKLGMDSAVSVGYRYTVGAANGNEIYNRLSTRAVVAGVRLGF
jgi:hypothetical protein